MTTPTTKEQLVNSGFVTALEASKFLGVSRSHIYALMERGELPYSRFGNSRRIPRQAMIEFATKSLVGVEE